VTPPLATFYARAFEPGTTHTCKDQGGFIEETACPPLDDGDSVA
jgi:hypothetical protein